MKFGILFSGGKDSVRAFELVRKHHEIVCLITMISKNKESYMFHTPNINLTELQAQAMGLPLIRQTTKGEKELELEDLKTALSRAKRKYGIQGIATGAIESNYQRTRIQKICHTLDLKCENPLWKKDQTELLRELVEDHYQILISGVFAYPFTEDWLGKKLDNKMIKELSRLENEYKINPSGEGGEIETTVMDAPFFKKEIIILEQEKKLKNYAGTVKVKKAELTEKK